METDELLSDLVCESPFSAWLLIRSQRHRRPNRHRSGHPAISGHLRSQARENRAANDYTKAQPTENPMQKEPDPRAKLVNNNFVTQLATVRLKDGKTITKLSPDNNHLLDHIAQFRCETVVLRSIRFDEHFVPLEYEAFAERAARLKNLPYDGRIDLPITFPSLRIAVEREKEFGGHLLESGLSMPRPESRGGCDCAPCLKMADAHSEEKLLKTCGPPFQVALNSLHSCDFAMHFCSTYSPATPVLCKTC